MKIDIVKKAAKEIIPKNIPLDFTTPVLYLRFLQIQNKSMQTLFLFGFVSIVDQLR